MRPGPNTHEAEGRSGDEGEYPGKRAGSEHYRLTEDGEQAERGQGRAETSDAPLHKAGRPQAMVGYGQRNRGTNDCGQTKQQTTDCAEVQLEFKHGSCHLRVGHGLEQL